MAYEENELAENEKHIDDMAKKGYKKIYVNLYDIIKINKYLHCSDFLTIENDVLKVNYII